MNKLAKTSKSTTSSYLYGKNYTYKKLYCKLNNIDTIIMDKDVFFSYNNLYNGNKYLKNIIIDLNNPENFIDIDLNSKTTIKNISYLNYPMLEGITIPIDILKERLGLKIFVSDRNNIKKINILNGETNEEINIDETISWYKIEKIKISEDYKLEIKIGYKNSDKKTITYDNLGNKKVSYKQQTIKNNNLLDLREYNTTETINYFNEDTLDTFILTPKLLKQKDLKNFTNILTEKLIILDDNEMLLNPKKLELHNVRVDIISTHSYHGNELSNIVYIEDMYDNNKTYIYLNEDNELKIINEENLKNYNIIDKYKFITKKDKAGVIIKYKKDLKFDLIINNKFFHINKIFINWFLNNTTKYDNKIIPREYKSFFDGTENIYDYDKKDYEYISEYIFSSLLEEIINNSLFDNFNSLYNKYQYYVNYIKDLLNKGYSYRALIYLHKNGFDNITGIKGNYRDIEDEYLIDSFNDISKKLIKRK